MCPDGYRTYIKEDTDKQQTNWNRRSARRMYKEEVDAPNRIDDGGESVAKGGKFNQNLPYPLRVHAGPPIFESSHNMPYEPPKRQSLRTEFAKGAKSLPKHRHMGGFNHPKSKSGPASPRTPVLASEVAGLEDLDSQVAGLEAYEGPNRQGKRTERGDRENSSEKHMHMHMNGRQESIVELGGPRKLENGGCEGPHVHSEPAHYQTRMINQGGIDDDLESEDNQPNNSRSKEKPTHRDDHAIDDHEAVCHEFKDHEVLRGCRGGTEQAGVGQGSMWHNPRQDGEPVTGDRELEEEQTCKDNHVSDDCDARYGHVIETHDGSQHHRGESEASEADNGSPCNNILTTDKKASELQKEELDQYWRPSYMFHWLKAVGGNVMNAYDHFKDYIGKESYDEMKLDRPAPMSKTESEGDESIWSHMSDYDEFGLAPEETGTQINGTDRNTVTGENLKGQDRVWSSNKQSYRVREWSADTTTTEESEHNGVQLACMSRGVKTNRRKPMEDSDDEGSDDEQEQFMCSMTGRQWEQLPFPIVIDSGACASVLPTDWCNHVNLLKTPQSEAKEFFRAANGKKIYNEGQKLITMMTKEGAVRDMNFIVCSVTKALGSVSQMCRAGNRVVFNPPWDPEGSYIENEHTGERLWLEEQGGLYVLHAKVAPQEKQTSNIYAMQTGFQWQANP